jgi:uncharacterized protein DUF2505
MNFAIQQQLGASPDQVQETLLDPEFVKARADLPKLGDAELVDSVRDDHSARQRVRLRFTAPLASAVTAVIDPSKLTWVDDATYNLTMHTAEHHVIPDHYGDRLSCTYSVKLEPVDGGTRRVLEGVVKVRMPLVGGKVERAIVSGLEEHAVAEAALISDWIAHH